MSLLHLVRREIRHRRGAFLLAVASALIAVAAATASVLALEAHDLRTAELPDAAERRVEERVQDLEDDYRRITKSMGYNVLILPGDQDLGEFYARGETTETLPESSADRLGASKIVTVNHLLPTLQRKVRWPEADRTIVLAGTKGQVPITHRDPKRPIQEAVPEGKIVLGHELARGLDLEPGDRTTLLGREFEVSRVHSPRGTADDITAWIALSTAQELLELPGRVSAIQALECRCPGDTEQRLETIRKEIGRILPDTKVLTLASKSEARVRARERAGKEAEDSLAAERARRASLRAERARLAGVLVPLAGLAGGLWIGLLALGNARDRSGEVGILRAVGLRSRDVATVLLGRAAVTGLVGGLLGWIVGVFLGAAWGGLGAAGGARIADPLGLSVALVAAPALAVVASLGPALLAARRDPASVLREIP